MIAYILNRSRVWSYMEIRIVVQDTPNCVELLKFIKSNVDLYSNFVKIQVIKLDNGNINDYKRIGVVKTPSLLSAGKVVEGLSNIKKFLNDIILKKVPSGSAKEPFRASKQQPRSSNKEYNDYSDYLEESAMEGANFVGGKLSSFEEERDQRDDFASSIHKATQDMNKARSRGKPPRGHSIRQGFDEQSEKLNNDFQNTRIALGEQKRQPREKPREEELEEPNDDNNDNDEEDLDDYLASAVKEDPNLD